MVLSSYSMEETPLATLYLPATLQMMLGSFFIDGNAHSYHFFTHIPSIYACLSFNGRNAPSYLSPPTSFEMMLGSSSMVETPLATLSPPTSFQMILGSLSVVETPLTTLSPPTFLQKILGSPSTVETPLAPLSPPTSLQIILGSFSVVEKPLATQSLPTSF